MIVKTSKGYIVKSKRGKTLSKPYKSRASALRRLRQIELFKHKGSATMATRQSR